MSLSAIKAAKKANAQAPGRGVADADSFDSNISILPLNSITERHGPDSRPIDDEHVEELALSIAAVGLIQPLAVDCKGRLLAGGHRKAALDMLWEYSETNDEELQGAWSRLFPNSLIPVRVFDFDSAAVPDVALLVEAAENEKRKDYTPVEVLKLYRRLEVQGYVKTSGRPKKGEKSLTKALEQITGKNRKQVNRLLAKGEAEQAISVEAQAGVEAKGLPSAKAAQADLAGAAEGEVGLVLDDGAEATAIAVQELEKVCLRSMKSLAKLLDNEAYDLGTRKDLVGASKKLGKVCTADAAKAIAKSVKA